MSLCYNASSVSATVNVTDGGVLSLLRIIQRNAGTSGASVTLDGGTLRAYASTDTFVNAHDALRFYAGANGATIDTNGKTITITEEIEDKSGESGTVIFAGNGAVTLGTSAGWTGGTTIAAGTLLKLPASVTNSVFSQASGIVISNPESIALDNVQVLECTDGEFTEDELAAISVEGDTQDRYEFVLVDGGSKILISDRLAGEYVWNDGASGASWRTSGKWSKNSVAGDWYDLTAAVFENADDAVTVDADVAAASIAFRANATVDGSASLTVPVVAVSNGVFATINAPIPGALEKTGAGTLTLSQSRTAQTTLSEGTLVMSGTASLDWQQFTFGTDAEKPVTLQMGADATLSNIPQTWWRIGNVEGLVLTLVKDGGNLTVSNIALSDMTGADTSFVHNGGTLSISGCFDIGSQAAAHFEIVGGVVTNTDKYIHMAPNESPADMTVRTGATYGMSANSLGLIVSGRSHGTLNVYGGDVFANGPLNLCLRGGDATVNVTDGGVLTFNKVQNNAGGADDPKGGTAAISIDGGTIRANANDNAFIPDEDNLTVTVGANGGTIDVNGKTITIEKELAGTGGMVFKGGGTITLSAAPTYSGTTTVEVGTTLVVPAAIAGADLAFAIPDGFATGVYKVMEVTGGGAFASDVLSSATLPFGANAGFFFDNDNKEIWCAYSSNASDHIWIGGSTGSLNDGANWLSGNVPDDGNVIIGSASAAALTNPDGSAFAAKRIIVPKDSAAVTVSGAAFSGITKIENYSTSQIEFLNAVTFANNVNVIQSPGIVKFTGGATGVQLGAATAIHGTYNFTATGDLTEIGGTTVKSDGVYKLLGGTFYKHNADFHMDAGGRAIVKDAKISRTSDATLLGTFNGEFMVTNEFLVTTGSSGSPTHYTCSSGNGTFIANKIRVIQGACIVPAVKTIMGPEGIIRGAGYVRVYNSGSDEFGSYADWPMYHNNRSNTATDGFVIYKHDSSGSWSTVTFDTTDYYDNTIGRTITSEALIGAANTGSAAKFRVAVKGIGKFVFANTTDSANIFSGGLTVNDSATVEVMPNSWPGRGAVTLNGTSTLLMHTGGAARTGAITVCSNATLKVVESGTVSLGGNLTLNDGATLAFNFTDKRTPPVLNLAGVALGEQKTVKVSLSSADGIRPAYTSGNEGKYELTSDGAFAAVKNDISISLVGNVPDWANDVAVNDAGNIVISVKRIGTIFLIM